METRGVRSGSVILNSGIKQAKDLGNTPGVMRTWLYGPW